LWFPAAAVVAGVAIEMLQGMAPPRSAEFNDVVAEVAGAGIATALFFFVRRACRRHDG
jgi:VanZ family protein